MLCRVQVNRFVLWRTNLTDTLGRKTMFKRNWTKIHAQLAALLVSTLLLSACGGSSRRLGDPELVKVSADRLEGDADGLGQARADGRQEQVRAWAVPGGRILSATMETAGAYTLQVLPR